MITIQNVIYVVTYFYFIEIDLKTIGYRHVKYEELNGREFQQNRKKSQNVMYIFLRTNSIVISKNRV